MADGLCKKCLKILCLHGYRQSAQTCKEKLGAFRKGLKKLPLEFVYITAPNKIPKKPSSTEEECLQTQEGSDEYGWWFSQADETYDPLTRTNICKGYQESLYMVKTTFDEQGPFDGIFAFSQGACFLSLLCALREQGVSESTKKYQTLIKGLTLETNQTERLEEQRSIMKKSFYYKYNPLSICTLKFDFAILVAGFKSKSSPHDSLYATPINCPSLHVFGDSDRVIPKENSQELLRYFLDPVTLNHPGGHFVPAQASHRKVYTEFLERFLQKKGD